MGGCGGGGGGGGGAEGDPPPGQPLISTILTVIILYLKLDVIGRLPHISLRIETSKGEIWMSCMFRLDIHDIHISPSLVSILSLKHYHLTGSNEKDRFHSSFFPGVLVPTTAIIIEIFLR